ncbi:unnamed protein product [Acanthoscelides obtectus]|uniref:Uncharacterized protein n=1 Tax=Acanthoscelides obtectus TaxID=200917 RepID=A0A9P0PWY1_ACAOB|nr:unnamed protein product [Acanthoscelides obtectus]CAK1646628.1 hypothetical protein AOBTE_LOCUS14767 [Acanthoscelides obtectus]
METDPGGSGNGTSTMAMEMESKEQTIEELRAELEMVRQEPSKKDDKKTIERLMMIIEAQQRTITELIVKLDLLLKTQVPSHLYITHSSQPLQQNPSKDKAVNLQIPFNNSSDLSTDDDTLPDGFTKVKPRKTRRNKTDTTGFPPLPPAKSQSETSHSTASDSNKQPVPNLSVTSSPSTSQVSEDTTAQPPRKVRVLRDASRWRGVNHKFISLGIKFERAVAVDAGIRIIPKSEDDYRRTIRLFREEEVHRTLPLPTERNIHAVIRGVPATLSETEIKEELQQRGYSPLHIIRLRRRAHAFSGSHTAQDRKISAAVQRTRAARHRYKKEFKNEGGAESGIVLVVPDVLQYLHNGISTEHLDLQKAQQEVRQYSYYLCDEPNFFRRYTTKELSNMQKIWQIGYLQELNILKLLKLWHYTEYNDFKRQGCNSKTLTTLHEELIETSAVMEVPAMTSHSSLTITPEQPTEDESPVDYSDKSNILQNGVVAEPIPGTSTAAKALQPSILSLEEQEDLDYDYVQPESESELTTIEELLLTMQTTKEKYSSKTKGSAADHDKQYSNVVENKKNDAVSLRAKTKP